MRIYGFLYLTLCLLVSISAAAKTNLKVETKSIRQFIDHSAPDRGTYQQQLRIIIPPGTPKNAPVLFFLGNEFGPRDLLKLAVPFLAERSAIVIEADHRGYGSYSEDPDQSVPTYVNSRQAVEDFHHVIQSLKTEFTGPWAIIGYSYGGTLAIQLAAKYPNDSQVVVASSALVRYPRVFSAHHNRMRSNLSPAFYERIEKKMASLEPKEVFDKNWHDRLFLENIFVGVIQYQAYAPLTGILEKASLLPTFTFIQVLKAFDAVKAKRLATNWAMSRGTRKLSLAQAKTQKFHGRYWAYQQCSEMGVFFTSSNDSKMFPQSVHEYQRECELMFGNTTQPLSDWDLLEEIRNMQTPVIFTAGDKDPWYDLGIQPSDMRPPGEFLLVKGGLHCPERDDFALGKQTAAAVFKYLMK